MNSSFLVHLTFLIFMISLSSCTNKDRTEITSPSENIVVEFLLTQNGNPAYTVKHKEEVVIDTSTIAFEFRNQPQFSEHFEIQNTSFSSVDETWEMPWGEQREVKNQYNELEVNLRETQSPNRDFTIYFRAYDDGAAIRYEFHEQDDLDSLMITDELTTFNLTGDHDTWWIPGDWDIYEHLYSTTIFSEIDAISKQNHDNLAQTYIPENAVNTPVTMRTASGLHLSFHEANLTDYAGMTLKIDSANLQMQSELVGSERMGYKVKRALPFKTPWRTIQVSEDAGGLIESRLIVNLNEPNKIGDVSWFKPMKYMGIWWELHLGKTTWDLQSGNHGATTENAKSYIDFAADNNIGGVLIEGWNEGWEQWDFDFTTPYPDYNLEEVVDYGREKGVEIIMHHETGAGVENYEQQLGSAYALMKDHGIHAVKTGYVGKIRTQGEYHHGQYMVNHYRKVLETAADNQVALNVHEPIKATGLRRTYPNMVTREGLRGQEFNAWADDGGNPPEHLPIVAFTRMLAGPIDFTPGIFNIKLDPYKENNQVNTTLSQQLALYVVIYSPLQMAADLIEHFEGEPAFQFIRDVGVDWEQSKVLNGEVGEFVTIAREEKQTGDWFVGSITNEEARSITIDFSFLEDDTEYEATFYTDTEDAHWDENPESINISSEVITSKAERTFNLAPGGGFAISLIKADNN